jgi:hypothetical protein
MLGAGVNFFSSFLQIGVLPMWEEVKRNFILQQGFEEPPPALRPRQYSALHFQPRTVFLWIVAGILFQYPPVFYLLCAVLWWSALLPKLNPFDAVYNLTFGGNRLAASYLKPAPAPRRVSQAMAGMLALACGLLLHFGFFTAAYVVEGILVAAVLALVLGGFCLGSFLFHLLSGKTAFACQTLPWATQSQQGLPDKLPSRR